MARPVPSGMLSSPNTPLPSWTRDGTGRRIAVLGADGFIGSHVVRTALAAGTEVVALCVKNPWRLADLEGSKLAIERVPEGRWWTPGGANRIGESLSEVEALVVLAYKPPADRFGSRALNQELRTNAGGAARLARLAAAHELRFVFASSADVYGPWHEKPVSEQVSPDPVSAYARAKWEAERLVADAFGRARRHVSLRFSTVYGPGENGPRAIPSFIRAFARGARPVVRGAGGDVRDYVHVQDVSIAVLNAALGATGATVLNVGSGTGRSTLEVLAAVAATMGVPAGALHEPSTTPPSRLVLDIRGARAELGYEPTADFRSALREEVGWLTETLARAS